MARNALKPQRQMRILAWDVNNENARTFKCRAPGLRTMVRKVRQIERTKDVRLVSRLQLI